MLDPAAESQVQLRQFLEYEVETLLPTLRWYLRRAGLADSVGAEQPAVELMNEVVVEALASAGRFQPGRPPRAWLLGIAANLIQRKQAALARLNRREPLVGDLVEAQDGPSEEELFDRLAGLQVDSPEQIVMEDQEVGRLLEGLSLAERQVIELAVLAGMNGQELARELGISPGAARVRLHRALRRLRERGGRR